MAIIETRHAQPGPSMTAPPPDLYDVLGLAPSATQDQVRHAYLDLVRRHHPDLRTAQQPAQEPRHAATREPAASDEVLRQVLAAYAVLGDRGRRARYDNDRHRAGTGTRVPPPRATWERRAGQLPIQAGPVHWRRG